MHSGQHINTRLNNPSTGLRANNVGPATSRPAGYWSGPGVFVAELGIQLLDFIGGPLVLPAVVWSVHSAFPTAPASEFFCKLSFCMCVRVCLCFVDADSFRLAGGKPASISRRLLPAEGGRYRCLRLAGFAGYVTARWAVLVLPLAAAAVDGVVAGVWPAGAGRPATRPAVTDGLAEVALPLLLLLAHAGWTAAETAGTPRAEVLRWKARPRTKVRSIWLGVHSVWVFRGR